MTISTTDSNPYDVAIVGLGAMGSAAAYHLARRGLRVLGLDRYTPPHSYGSSHGKTRAIRAAYYEHPLYVPIVLRAFDLWAELERESGQQLLNKTGALMIGHPDSALVSGSRSSAELHQIAHEMLSAGELGLRYPAIQADPDHVALWEPGAGILCSDACIQAHLDGARRAGAALHLDEAVESWKMDGPGVNISTRMDTYRADRLILTAGAWMRQLLPSVSVPLSVERQVLFWFEPKRSPGEFEPGRFPFSLWEFATDEFFYGFPNFGDGVKLARHHSGGPCEPDTVNRDVSIAELEDIRALAGRLVPNANGEVLSSVVCMYTNTPDCHFLIDTHPNASQVLIASPCSGHGFKFSPAIGEIIADWVEGKASRYDTTLFQIARMYPWDPARPKSYPT